MHLDDSQLPFEPAWEGELAPPAGVFAKGDGLPTVSLGRPASSFRSGPARGRR
ncbi:MAG: hypothetical protein ACT4QE_25745 [Anaerolineales bacterium]